MRVLCTNDDGIRSPGLHALAHHLRLAGHDVLVAAPAEDLSGASAAIGRLHVDHLGAFGEPPDVVVSGINSGLNTGHSVLHSGTVGATGAALDPDSDTALVEAGFVTLTAIAGVAEVDIGRDTPPGVDADRVARELREAPAPS
jgi:broad specificity polyphosphatase/5'/3'-nucleotidase SurE